MEQHKIDRINELARKKKSDGLLPHEQEEQAALHREYIDEFKSRVASTLDNTYLQRPDGTKEKLRKKK